jgi:hypothetical protein
MTNPTLTQIARALLEADHPEASEASKREYWEIYGSDYLHHTRSVIQALIANISEEMKAVGGLELPFDGYGDVDAVKVFTAMLNAAHSTRCRNSPRIVERKPNAPPSWLISAHSRHGPAIAD